MLQGSIHNYWSTNPKTSFSWLSNKLLKLKSVVFPLIRLQIQNGRSGRFWFDNWSPFGSLDTYLGDSVSRLGINRNATVASLNRNGSWLLPNARSEEQLNLLAFITTVQLNSQPDYYEWVIEGKVSEEFKTGEVYHYLRGEFPAVPWTKAVWPSKSIPRQNFHCWLTTLDRLPTRDRMIGWGLQVSPLCLLCNSSAESRNHLYWECSFSFDLWNRVALRCGISPSRDWNASLNQMVALSLPRALKSLALLAWQSTQYWIWNERNTRLHAGTFRSVDTIYTTIDRQIRNKIGSLRQSNAIVGSEMMQAWFRRS